MQSDPTARLKLLSVLKVSNASSSPPVEEKKEEPQKSNAVQQLKQVLFKGTAQGVTAPSPPPQLAGASRASPLQPATSAAVSNWKEMGPPGLTSPLKPPALMSSEPTREMPSLIPNQLRSTPPAAPEPPVQAIIESKTENDVQENPAPTSAPPGTTPAAPRRRLFFIRTAATSKGQLDLLWRGQTASKDMILSDGFKLRPGATLTCAWKLPLELFTAKPNEEGKDAESSPEPKLMIGLYRFGCHSNKEGSIISKELMEESQERRDDNVATSPRYRSGKIKFFAPKSAGVYLFRIYDANATDGIFDALAISCKIMIVLMDRDIAKNLKFVLKAFTEESKLKGIGLFNLILPHIKNRNDSGGNGNNNNNNIPPMVDMNEMIQDINSCVEELLYAINDTMELIDEGQLRKAMNALTIKANETGEVGEAEEIGNDETPLEGNPVTATEGTTVKKPRAGSITEEAADGDQEFWKRYRTAMKIHLEAYETLVTLIRQKTPWYWITEGLKTRVKHGVNLFCPFLRRFFPSITDMQASRRKALHFTPPTWTHPITEEKDRIQHSRYSQQSSVGTSFTTTGFDRQIAQQLSKALFEFIHPVMVTPQFEQDRQTLCQKIEDTLRQQGFLPQPVVTHTNVSTILPPPPALSLPTSFRLALYGSSRNGFGASGSDIDICLALSQPCHDSIMKLKIMCDLEEKLLQVGMKEVKALLTARVPIVEFIDKDSGANVDISFQNDLAVTNTEMLRVYSQIDTRVRLLVYVIKHWAKIRQINSPQQGTLGSYGYVLTVIHFLQNRPIPILPCLQSLSVESMTTTTTTTTSSSMKPGVGRYHENGMRNLSNSIPTTTLERMMINPIDQTRCNLYYFQPTPEQLQSLQAQAQQNKESLSELLVEYFKYYAYQFDFRNQVVSIRDRKPIWKVDKYEYFCWPHTDLLAIEDPFEIHYDVAHVLRTGKMVLIRKELLRAYTILSRCLLVENSTGRHDRGGTSLAGEETTSELFPRKIPTSQAIDLLFEQVVEGGDPSTTSNLSPEMVTHEK